MNNKAVALLILILTAVTSIYAEPVNMIILLDTSSDTADVYEDIINHAVKNLLTRYLRIGDSLHLVTFDKEPVLIYSKHIRLFIDIENVMSELSLITPSVPHKDIVKALRYVNRHINSISAGISGKKELLIISDGIHSPSPGSIYSKIIYKNYNTNTEINILEDAVMDILKTGWSINAVKLENNSSSMENQNNLFSYFSDISRIHVTLFSNNSEFLQDITATGAPRIYYSDNPEKINYNFSFPVQIQNFYKYPVFIVIDKVIDTDSSSSLLKERITINLKPEETKKINLPLIIPDTVSEGVISKNIELLFSDNYRAYPAHTVINTYLERNIKDYLIAGKNHILQFLVVLIILLSVAGFIIILKKYLNASFYGSSAPDISEENYQYTDILTRPLVMKVEGQNNNVIPGKNILRFEKNTVKTVGGGNSSFLVLIYNVPENIAEISYDGTCYSFNPVDTRYFPGFENNSTVMDFLDRNIKIKTDKNKQFTVMFSEYISPLEKINTVLKLTENKGKPGNRKSVS